MNRTPPLPFNFEGTNNTTEYEASIHGIEAALTLGIEAALTLGIEEIEVGDSALIICQTQGKWKTKDEKLLC